MARTKTLRAEPPGELVLAEAHHSTVQRLPHDDMIDLGNQTYLSANEIIGFQAGISSDQGARLILPPVGLPKCVVILRSGLLMPGYYSVKTLRAKWEGALRAGLPLPPLLED